MKTSESETTSASNWLAIKGMQDTLSLYPISGLPASPPLITFHFEALVVSLSDIVHRCVFMCKILHIGQLKG